MNIVHIDGENFNDIFRKDVTYDNMKIKKKNRASSSLYKRNIFGKTRWGVSN